MAAAHALTLQTYISSRTQLGKPPNSKILASTCQALWKRKRISLSVRAMGSSASSSQKPDNIRGNVSEEELKKRLTPEQYYVTLQKGTERAFTGYNSLHRLF